MSWTTFRPIRASISSSSARSIYSRRCSKLRGSENKRGPGASNKAIGRKLGIIKSMVNVHLGAIMRKLRVKNRTQAAIWATRQPPLNSAEWKDLGGPRKGERTRQQRWCSGFPQLARTQPLLGCGPARRIEFLEPAPSGEPGRSAARSHRDVRNNRACRRCASSGVGEARTFCAAERVDCCEHAAA